MLSINKKDIASTISLSKEVWKKEIVNTGEQYTFSLTLKNTCSSLTIIKLGLTKLSQDLIRRRGMETHPGDPEK